MFVNKTFSKNKKVYIIFGARGFIGRKLTISLMKKKCIIFLISRKANNDFLDYKKLRLLSKKINLISAKEVIIYNFAK